MRNAGLWLLLALFPALPSTVNVLLLLQPVFALFFLAMILVSNQCL